MSSFSLNLAGLLNKITSNYPRLTILFNLILIAVLAYGCKFLEFNSNYRVFFSHEDPNLTAFNEIEQTYQKSDNILIAIQPKEGEIFQPRVLKLIQELTSECWQLPFTQRVNSITNFQFTKAFGDDLFVDDLVSGDPNKLSEAKLAEIKFNALNEPFLINKLISADARTSGINIYSNMPRKSVDEVPLAANAALKLVEKYQQLYPDIKIVPSGIVMMNNAFIESASDDMNRLSPIMYLVLIIIMVAILRSFGATFATVVVIFGSAAAAMGAGGWLDYPLTPPSAVTATIVLTLAVADSIHLIATMFKQMATGMNKKEAIAESLRINLQPVIVTSVTTAIGFLSLNFSETPPFWHLGNMSAVGIMMALWLSVTLLPAMLQLLPLKNHYTICQQSNWSERFSDFIIKHFRSIFGIAMASTLILGSLIFKIELNDEFTKYFDRSIPFRNNVEFVADHLTGVSTVEFSIGSGQANGITDPSYLRVLNNFSEWLRSQPEILNVISFSDIMKRLNKNMHGDNPNYYQIPSNSEVAAQYLLMYEFSLPYGLDLNDQVTLDKSATRTTATLKILSTKEYRDFKFRAEEWLYLHAPPKMFSEATSAIMMFSHISKRNIDSMIKGNLISLLLISLCMMLMLRSTKIGFISLLPNLAPIAIGYGIWEQLVGQINLAASVAGAVSIGIIVDDSVHFLAKYLRAKRERNLNAKEAIKYAFNNVGNALLVTTVILVCGFMVLATSSFQVNSYLGLLTTIVIISALIADFLLLPSLLLILDDNNIKLVKLKIKKNAKKIVKKNKSRK